MMLAEKLQKLRQEKGLSQEQLAEQLEVSRQAVGKWESGQSRPDMDKLVALAALFDVSTDYLLREEGTFYVPPKRRWSTAVLTAALLLAVGAAAWFGLAASRSSGQRQALEAKKEQLLETEKALKTELQTAQTALAEAQSGTPEFAALEDYYYQFAQTYRLDYIPEFTEGNAPTESQEYLFWAFALNLDNWGDQKGTMSKGYVEDVVRTHFGLGSLTHLSQFKAWDFDGENYTALPQGIREIPVCFLQSYQIRQRDGVTCHEIVVDFAAHRGGELVDPAAMGADTLGQVLTAYDRLDFGAVSRERFVYTTSSFGMGEPVFVAHEVLAEGDGLA